MAYIYCNDYLLLIGLCKTVKEGKYKGINMINWNNWLNIWKKVKKYTKYKDKWSKLNTE